MSSSVGAKKATGKVTGTGAAIEVLTGFTPSTVKLMNVTGLAELWWTDSMEDDEGVKRITAGTMTFESSGGITPLEKSVPLPSSDQPGHNFGFTIGTDTDLNQAAEVIHWVAWE